MTADFKQFWQKSFLGQPPMGYMLKHCLKERWIRFHSLPNAKRYPSSQAEYDIVLMRANALASEVLGEGAPCWVVVNYIGKKPFDGQKDVVKSHNLQPSFHWEDPFEDEDEKVKWTAYAGKYSWQSGLFDDLIKNIADEETRVLWVSEATGAIFAPYPGGSDIILPNASFSQNLMKKYGKWFANT